jgi:hypothetical protein
VFRKTIPICLGLALAACTSDPVGQTNPPDGGMVVVEPDGGGMTGEDGGMMQAFPESGKASLRFKRNERMRNDFAQALALPPAELCRELGQYSCTDFVHQIALGGVEPYVLGLREALDFTTITAPIATDRVALAGCEQRVTRDFNDEGSAVIFSGLGVDANGAIPDLAAAGVRESLDRLYKRALLRPPSDAEVAHLRQLYRDVAGTNEPGAAREWAILSCYAVLTTMESLFY